MEKSKLLAMYVSLCMEKNPDIPTKYLEPENKEEKKIYYHIGCKEYNNKPMLILYATRYYVEKRGVNSIYYIVERSELLRYDINNGKLIHYGFEMRNGIYSSKFENMIIDATEKFDNVEYKITTTPQTTIAESDGRIHCVYYVFEIERFNAQTYRAWKNRQRKHKFNR